MTPELSAFRAWTSSYTSGMRIGDKIKILLRRRPATEEELTARAEAKTARDEVLQDRLSQESRAGQLYRSGGH